MSIQEVLLLLSDPLTGSHQLEFVRATGKKKGSIKSVTVRSGRSHGYKKTTRKRRSTMHVYSSTIPLIDIATNHPITPFISHFVKFNGEKIKH